MSSEQTYLHVLKEEVLGQIKFFFLRFRSVLKSKGCVLLKHSVCLGLSVDCDRFLAIGLLVLQDVFCSRSPEAELSMDFFLARLECRGFVTKSESIEASHKGPTLQFLLSKNFLPKIATVNKNHDTC